MTSRYIRSLRGEPLEAFTRCMRQKGKFSYHHVNTKTGILKGLELRGLLKIEDRRPNVYVVPDDIAKGYMKRFPDERVKYIESDIPTSRSKREKMIREHKMVNNLL